MGYNYLSHSEIRENYDALIQRYKSGEFGPITFKNKASELRIDADEIQADMQRHVDECARNIRA